MSTELLIAVIGSASAIIGGLGAGVPQMLVEKCRRPKLKLIFRETTNGAVHSAYVAESSWPHNTGGIPVKRKIIRVSVQNTGKSVARNCRVHIVKIEEVQTGGSGLE